MLFLPEELVYAFFNLSVIFGNSLNFLKYVASLQMIPSLLASNLSYVDPILPYHNIHPKLKRYNLD